MKIPHNEPWCDDCKNYHRAPTKEQLNDGVYHIDGVLHLNHEHPQIKQNQKELHDAITDAVFKEIDDLISAELRGE